MKWMVLLILALSVGCDVPYALRGPYCTELQVVPINRDVCRDEIVTLPGDIQIENAWLQSGTVYRVYLEGIANAPGIALLGTEPQPFLEGHVLVWWYIQSDTSVTIPIVLDGQGKFAVTAAYVIPVRGTPSAQRIGTAYE